MVSLASDLLRKPKTRPISDLATQLQSYKEARPDPYAPAGFEFERPKPRQQNLSGIAELSRAGTRVTQQQAFNTAIQQQQAEMARLQELARQQIDLSGITPQFSGNLSREQINQIQYGDPGAGARGLGRPLSGYRITSGYGPRSGSNVSSGRISSNHTGIDLAAPAGTPIYATHNGVVGKAGWSGGYGNLVTINGGNGLSTYYAHQSRLNVESGQRVRKGQVIGYVGSTGRSTGNHLHYEVRIGGQHINPRGYL